MRNIVQYKRQVRGSEELVTIPCRMINGFCMFSDYVPLTLDEWIEVDRKRREEYFRNHPVNAIDDTIDDQ